MLLVSTAGIISDFLTELVRLVVTEEDFTEEIGGVVEDETGEVVFLIDRALTNLSPKDPRSWVDGGSSLKNKLLYRGGNRVTVSNLQGLPQI